MLFFLFVNKSVDVASLFCVFVFPFCFSSQVIPLRASNLLQTELKKIVFLGNKDYMQSEVETFSFIEKQQEIRNSLLFGANCLGMFVSVVWVRYIRQVQGRLPMVCLLRGPLPITVTCRSVIDVQHLAVGVFFRNVTHVNM